jgi:hypothetical protein
VFGIFNQHHAGSCVPIRTHRSVVGQLNHRHFLFTFRVIFGCFELELASQECELSFLIKADFALSLFDAIVPVLVFVTGPAALSLLAKVGTHTTWQVFGLYVTQNLIFKLELLMMRHFLLL